MSGLISDAHRQLAFPSLLDALGHARVYKGGMHTVSNLATARTGLVLVSASDLIVVSEEVGVPLVTEGQAQDSLRVGYGVTLAI